MNKIIALIIISMFSSAVLSARVGDKNLGWPGETLLGNQCYGADQGYGPYDYADPAEHQRKEENARSKIETVEDFHFTQNVEYLVSGTTDENPYGDIAYTIRAYPNHHRALWAMSRYYLQKLAQVGEAQLARNELGGLSPTPPECFFNRAIYFAPKDKMLNVIFGAYLHRRGHLDLAKEKYLEAEKALPRHPELIYNMGLLYVDLGDLQMAREYADKAHLLGYPLKGLSNKIDNAERSNQQSSSEKDE